MKAMPHGIKAAYETVTGLAPVTLQKGYKIMNKFFSFLGVTAVVAGAAYLVYKMYDRKFIHDVLVMGEEDEDPMDFCCDGHCDCGCCDDCEEPSDETAVPAEDEYLTIEEIIAAEGDNDEII